MNSTESALRRTVRQSKVQNPLAASPDVIAIMVERIVKGFKPLRVILFGSWARGTANQWSDVDLLVVFPALEGKREMAINIRHSLDGLSVCKDILVSTPDEISGRGQIVGTVLHSALCEGKVLYDAEASESHCSNRRAGTIRNAPNRASSPQSLSEALARKNRISEGQLWLRYSAEDLALAVHGLTDEASRPRHVCWHAQQAAGMALKAAFILEGKDFPYTCDLAALIELLPETWPLRRARINLAPLTGWAVAGRYPGDWRESTEMDAEEAVHRARRVHDSVMAEFNRRLGDARPSEYRRR